MARKVDGQARRTLIKQAGLAGLAVAMAPSASAWSAVLPPEWFQDADEVIPFSDIPENFNPRRDGKLVRLDLRELKSFITPADEMFTVQHYGVPAVDAAQWKLEVTGNVARPLSFTLDDLKKRRQVERTVFFECGGNRAQGMHALMANATYVGTPLKDILAEAGARPDTLEWIFWGADEGEETIRSNKYSMHFARSMSVADASAGNPAEAILAHSLNGAPLPQAHGFPVRLIVPGWYGVANVKWLSRIEASTSRFMGRFMGRDYVTIMGRQIGDKVEYTETSVTRMRVKSVVARVTRSKTAGRTKVFGVAYTDGTPLERVEVQIDEGAWQPARLEAQPNPFAWTFWSLDAAPLASGTHAIVSRATDRQGRVQPANLDLKKTYWEDNAQFRRTVAVP
jgi:DMSO/TMAO reductase YedYZ molybdopterin-dependent catalytic subunit